MEGRTPLSLLGFARVCESRSEASGPPQLVPPLSDWVWSEADKQEALVILRRKRHDIEALPEGSSEVMLQALDDVIEPVKQSLPRRKGKGQPGDRWRVPNPFDLVL